MDATTGRYEPIARAPSRYFYPGGTIGGPVRIPGTSFNENKHLTFWAGFEYYDQLTNANGSFSGPQFAFVPNSAMLGGDFSNANLASAFNVNATDLLAGCSEPYSVTAAYSNIGGDCYSPTSNNADVTGKPVNGGMITGLDKAFATFTALYPKPNTVPQPANGYASSGYNWAKNVMATNNGFQFHSRVDENISDSLKLYGVYNWEKVNTQAPLNNIYYNPPDTVPYPTPLNSNGDSNSASLNLTKVVSRTITNELVVSGLYFDEPQQFQNRAAALDSGTPWASAGYEGGALKNGINQLPRIYSYESIGIPNFSFGFVPAGSEYLRKSSWDAGDNLTKIYGTHTIKVGVYAEQTRNNQVTLGSQANGELGFARWNGCIPNQTAPSYSQNEAGDLSLVTPGTSSLGNTAANFVSGCATAGYTQASGDPSVDMYFDSLEFYGTDEWKVNSKLTLTFGIRLSHLPPWTDSHGIGAAVWDTAKYNAVSPHVLEGGVTQSATTWPGISWHQLDTSIPVAGVGSRALFYAPRVGLAYDLYGNGKVVFRGGWGAYRSRDSYNLTSGAVSTATNLVNYIISSGFADACTAEQLFNPAPTTGSMNSYPHSGKYLPCGYYTGTYTGTLSGGSYTGTPAFQAGAAALNGSGAIGSIYAADPSDNEQPVTYNYNFTVDQQLPFSSTLEIAYVGNQSANLATLGNLQNQNVIPLGAFFGPDPLTQQVHQASNITSSEVNDYRPYPNYQSVYVPHHTNWGNYNAMQVSLNKQRGALVYGINYTWSKAMAVRGNYDTGYIADPVNASHDYGVVSFDRPQAANFTYAYQEGNRFHVNRELGWVVNNWELSGITKLTSGPDLAISNGTTNFSFSAAAGYVIGTTPSLAEVGIPVGAQEWLGTSDYTLQPTVTCDPRVGLRSATLSGSQVSRQYVNGKCFGLPAQGTQGWWNLPDVHGPAFFSSDLSVYKDVQIDDRQTLQFRMSAFNFLNHPISSFNSNNLAALNLTFADPPCNTTTGAGCFTSQQAAFSGLTLQNAGSGTRPTNSECALLNSA